MVYSKLFWWQAAFFVFGCHMPTLVYAGSHSFQYYFTLLHQKRLNEQWYSIVGIMDGTQVGRYDSSLRQAQPLYDWMRDSPNHEFWKENTELAQQYECNHRTSLEHIQRIVNRSAEVSTYQIKYQCERYDDGSIGGHTDFGYNGRDFIFFDKDSLRYYPATSQAEILTQQWNTNPTDIRRDKTFAEEHCIEWINRYKNIFRDKVKNTEARPEVKVWGRQQPDGVTRLQCLAYGFHPRAVDVKWVRNGEDHIPSDEASPILPHPDGTYQTRVSVEVPTREGDTYACHVEHSSLEETLTVTLEDLNLTDQQPSFERRRIFIPYLIAIFMLVLILLLLCVQRTSGCKNKMGRELSV